MDARLQWEGAVPAAGAALGSCPTPSGQRRLQRCTGGLVLISLLSRGRARICFYRLQVRRMQMELQGAREYADQMHAEKAQLQAELTEVMNMVEGQV